MWCNVQIIVISAAVPSTIAASITWPGAAALGFEQRADDAERQQHAAAAEVADHVDRRRRSLAGPAEVGERAGERDVVDVVAGRRRVRAVLAPPGHAAEHQLRVACEAHVGPDAEPLHDAGAEALDQRVGRGDEVEHDGDAVGVLEIDGDVAPVAAQQIAVRGLGGRAAHRHRRARRGRPRRPCRRASCRRTAPGRCRPARRS